MRPPVSCYSQCELRLKATTEFRLFFRLFQIPLGVPLAVIISVQTVVRLVASIFDMIS